MSTFRRYGLCRLSRKRKTQRRTREGRDTSCRHRRTIMLAKQVQKMRNNGSRCSEYSAIPRVPRNDRRDDYSPQGKHALSNCHPKRSVAEPKDDRKIIRSIATRNADVGCNSRSEARIRARSAIHDRQVNSSASPRSTLHSQSVSGAIIPLSTFRFRAAPFRIGFISALYHRSKKRTIQRAACIIPLYDCFPPFGRN